MSGPVSRIYFCHSEAFDMMQRPFSLTDNQHRRWSIVTAVPTSTAIAPSSHGGLTQQPRCSSALSSPPSPPPLAPPLWLRSHHGARERGDVCLKVLLDGHAMRRQGGGDLFDWELADGL